MKDYIIQFKDHNYMIHTETVEELVTKVCEKLNTKTSFKFSKNTLKLELYHSSLQCYYEIEDEMPPDSAILRASYVDTSTREKSVDVINDLDETNPVGESCSSRSIRTSAKPKEHCRPEEPSTSACPSLPWPHEFKIREQSMPQSVRCALQNKERLTKPITVSLMDFLYETITQYTFFLRKSQSLQVAEELLSKYPKLELGLDYQHALEYWRQKISEKMRNMRKRRDRDVPVIIASREKRNSLLARNADVAADGKQPSSIKKSTPGYGLKNYLPCRQVSEDDASVERHRLLMLKEFAKTRRDPRAIETSMVATFHDRRDRIVNKWHLLAQLKEDYPCLFVSHQMCYEFERISEINILETLQSSLLEYGPAILSLTKTSADFDSTFYSVEQKQDLLVNTAALKIPQLLNEQMDFSTDLNEEPAPAIRLEGECGVLTPGKILADGLVLCTTETKLEALACWFASYANLNLHYPSRWKKSLVFIQKFLLNLEDGTKTPMAVLKTIKKVKEYKNNS